MSNELNQLLDEYRDHVRLYVWYMPSPFSFVQGKANKQLAAQHRNNAHVAWSQYMEKKKAGK